MKRVAKLICSLAICVFLASSVSWGEQTDKKDSTPSATKIQDKTILPDDSDAKKKAKEKSDSEALKRAEQYLKYSGPGFGIKKGWVAGGRTYIVPPRHSYHNYYYYPPPPLLYPDPYHEWRLWSNNPLKQTLEATQLWNEICRIFPRPTTSQLVPVYVTLESEPETKQVAKLQVTPTTKSIVGEIAGIILSTADAVVIVRADGKEQNYTVAQDAVILRGPVDEPAIEISLSKVKAGDQVTLRVEKDTVTLIRVQYKVLTGKVEAIAKGTVLLNTGETFKITSETKILLPDKTKGKPDDIKAGSMVNVQVSPTENEALVIEITAAE